MPNNEEQRQLLNNLLSQLSAEDRKKLDSILADKSATEKILSTPEAQQLMKKFTGGK